MFILKTKQIKKCELIINEIYSKLMIIDERFSKYGSDIDETMAVEQLKLKMDELWNSYWDLSKEASSINISYIGFGRAANLIEVLEHLMYIWINVIVDKLKLDIHHLSINWVNFTINKKLWNQITK